MSNPLIIDGGILAGGLASRMQGEDKGLQLFRQKPMADWIYQALLPHVRKVMINCNRNQLAYSQISEHLSSDSISGHPGPLAGLVSLLDASDADYLLISPCDTPLLNSNFAIRMLAHLQSQHSLNADKPLLFAVSCRGKQHPLHVCISKEFRSSLVNFLQKGEHRVMKWMQENHATWLDFSDEAESYRNFNTLEDVNTY